MKFSYTARKGLTGAKLALHVLELSAMLPPLYVIVASGYPGLLTRKGFFGFLFRFGAALIPRAWLLALSRLYQRTASEILFCFAVLIPALLISVWLDGLFRGRERTAKLSRIVFAGLLALELVLRLLPLRVNSVFGTPAAVLSFVVIAACLTLTVLDLIRKEKQ